MTFELPDFCSTQPKVHYSNDKGCESLTIQSSDAFAVDAIIMRMTNYFERNNTKIAFGKENITTAIKYLKEYRPKTRTYEPYSVTVKLTSQKICIEGAEYLAKTMQGISTTAIIISVPESLKGTYLGEFYKLYEQRADVEQTAENTQT